MASPAPIPASAQTTLNVGPAEQITGFHLPGGQFLQNIAAVLNGAAMSVATWTGGLAFGLSVLAASGAVPLAQPGVSVVTKAGVAALTLAAPTSGTQDGTVLTIVSSTAYAHTLTATGLFQTGSASVNLATFAAFAGAGLSLMAYQGKWIVLSSVGITFS